MGQKKGNFVWIDTVHHIKAQCTSKTAALQLIRSTCYENKTYPIPTIDQIMRLTVFNKLNKNKNEKI